MLYFDTSYGRERVLYIYFYKVGIETAAMELVPRKEVRMLPPDPDPQPEPVPAQEN